MSWHKHPGVRSGGELSLGERSADRLRAIMGSWPFVFGFLGFMAVWMALNGVAWFFHWDVYPYVLLNLCLSCLAGLQGAILLIAAKRADQIASELAHHDFAVNQQALDRIERIISHLGIDDSGEREPNSPADGPVGGDRRGFFAP